MYVNGISAVLDEFEGIGRTTGAGKATKEMGDALHAGTIGLFEKAHKLIAQA